MRIFLTITLLFLIYFIPQAQTVTTIGSGTSLDFNPFYTSYTYVYEANLYLQSEIGSGSGTITGLNWYSTIAGSASPIKIYLKEISNSTVPAETWTTISSGATLVYSGTVTLTANAWSGVTLSTSFSYTGTNNLLVLTEMVSATGYFYIRYTSTTGTHGRMNQNSTPPTGAFTAWNDRANIQLISTGTLPIELTSFTASVNKNSILLNWQTATEKNNYGFNIERKVKDGEWGTVGFVQGSGNSNSLKEYSFKDVNLKTGDHQYRLKQIDNDGFFKYSKEVEVSVGNIPIEFALEQNYPNPFNPTTTFKYALPEAGKVRLEVFNIIGESVNVLVNENMEAGYHTVKFNGTNLSSGIYIYRLIANNQFITKKMSLLK